MRGSSIVNTLLLAFLLTGQGFAQFSEAPINPPPDDRLKADILLISAHADDDILVIGYLLRAAIDQHKRVAVIYTTGGERSQNRVGNEQSASLAIVREMEGRQMFASMGVPNVWFLGAPNLFVPMEDPLGSLEKWSHGSILEKTVRLIRITRPEVVISFLPDYVVGQNHSDHQAAGIVATEAFDLAGDHLVFPEQVTPPLNHRGYGNMMEGLQAWQPKNLYYFSDTSHTEMLKGAGPVYLSRDISSSRGVPYSRLVAEKVSYYLSQVEGLPAKRALTTGKLGPYSRSVDLVLGKSLVKSSVTGDVFEGVGTGPIAFEPPARPQPVRREGITVELGSPWSFYAPFWKAHNLDRVAQMHPPEMGLKEGQTTPSSVTLLLRNDTDKDQQVTLTSALPTNWKEARSAVRYPVRAHSIYPLETKMIAPPTTTPEWQTITWSAELDGKKQGSVSLRVYSTPTRSDFRATAEPGSPDD